jgi:uncharacterized membrane protein (DUF2068 family)
MPEQRGGCLTAFLIFMFIVNTLTAFYYLFFGDAVRSAMPLIPAWAIPVLAVACILNVVFAVGVWQWRRWGVYGFIVLAILIFVLNITYVGLLPSLLGLLGPVILVLLVRTRWGQLT